jgi:hypothetical protein
MSLLSAHVAAIVALFSSQLQPVPPTRPATQAMTATRPLAATAPTSDGSTELTVRWTTALAGTTSIVSADAPPTASSFAVLARRTVPSAMVVERAPQLSEDQLVIVALDAAGTELGWQLCKDPRIIRAESPSPTGELAGRTLYRTDVEFVIATPAGVVPARFRIYKPQWNGTEYLLLLLGTVDNTAR